MSALSPVAQALRLEVLPIRDRLQQYCWKVCLGSSVLWYATPARQKQHADRRDLLDKPAHCLLLWRVYNTAQPLCQRIASGQTLLVAKRRRPPQDRLASADAIDFSLDRQIVQF